MKTIFSGLLIGNRILAVILSFFVLSTLSFSQIPLSGLQLWLKADDGVTLNGSTVSQWIDQSGNGNDATQSNTDRQPMFVDNGLNNKPVLHFDGVNDRLGLTGSSTMSQISLFIVFKIDSGLSGNNGTDPISISSNFIWEL